MSILTWLCSMPGVLIMTAGRCRSKSEVVRLVSVREEDARLNGGVVMFSLALDFLLGLRFVSSSTLSVLVSLAGLGGLSSASLSLLCLGDPSLELGCDTWLGGPALASLVVSAVIVPLEDNSSVFEIDENEDSRLSLMLIRTTARSGLDGRSLLSSTFGSLLSLFVQRVGVAVWEVASERVLLSLCFCLVDD